MATPDPPFPDPDRAPAAPRGRRHVVLLVTGKEGLQQLITRHITALGLHVCAASDGARGVREARRLRPHLIVIAGRLWDMDGIELCRRIRGVENVGDPFILLVVEPGDETRLMDAFQAGVDDSLTMPFQPSTLRARITAGERLLRLQSVAW